MHNSWRIEYVRHKLISQAIARGLAWIYSCSWANEVTPFITIHDIVWGIRPVPITVNRATTHAHSHTPTYTHTLSLPLSLAHTVAHTPEHTQTHRYAYGDTCKQRHSEAGTHRHT